MSEHRYILQPYDGMRTRYRCPGCQHRDKTFARYLDRQTGEHLAEHVGKCNRENSCGYHYTPKQYFVDNPIAIEKAVPFIPYTYQQPKQQTPKPYSQPVPPIPFETFKASLKGYEANCFVQYLVKLFSHEAATSVIEKYFIGTSKVWAGATVFYHINGNGQVRSGKIMLYHPQTGKRVKQPFDHIQWVHKAIAVEKPECRLYLFGEHLLSDSTKPVAMVESEKTAIIASQYLPAFIWLACGQLQGLNADKCQVLKGLAVVLFPDLKGLDKWTAKAKELAHITTFAVSDYLETHATEEEKAAGLDIADYLMQYNHREFMTPSTTPQQQTDIALPVTWNMPMVFHLSPELNHYQLATFQLSDGRLYDCLFDADNAFVTERESEAVKAVERQYSKQFVPGSFYGDRCLLHALTN